MRLTLTNNLTNRQWELSVTDNGSNSMYWCFPAVVLPAGMPDGEYTYILEDDAGRTCADGLMRIGNYTRNIVQPPTDNQFKQYNG